ncbi:12977_t:CDS:1, partial [Acaulospora colombiana]
GQLQTMEQAGFQPMDVAWPLTVTSTGSVPSHSMKLKIAIVGGGPSAFYCASRILSKLPIAGPRGKDVEVHMFDRLWAPHGLVRYGVAPDHPEVKVSNI